MLKKRSSKRRVKNRNDTSTPSVIFSCQEEHVVGDLVAQILSRLVLEDIQMLAKLIIPWKIFHRKFHFAHVLSPSPIGLTSPLILHNLGENSKLIRKELSSPWIDWIMIATTTEMIVCENLRFVVIWDVKSIISVAIIYNIYIPRWLGGLSGGNSSTVQQQE